jgi:HEPN domain-containing protein
MPAEPGANLWISQADSDLLAATRVYDAGDHRTCCQAIAKHQQTVEKSVKAIRAALHEGLIVSVSSGRNSHDVTKLASALRRPGDPADPTDIQHHINKLLCEHCINEIKAISALAPKLPKGGGLHERNTEYPYERLAGDWVAPALQGGFTTHEVQRFSVLAKRVYEGARQIVSALRRR